ncbi:hypothetical protein H4R18_005056 [Coemansia javaensis]|uniref:Peroxisomal biogenesis factor 11 n=1 Tax=Coemansia javaensis TaxID=2761396 RepID=A0A9W8LG61_9FUNG|nr:hypothetical protein H4R18_005056 [Coemansia javaensis]
MASATDSPLDASAVLVAHDDAADGGAAELDAGGGAAAPDAPSDEKRPGSPSKALRSNAILVLALRRRLKGLAPTLDHMVRFLSSGSGHDKFWMLTQYFTKIVVWALARGGQKSAAERVRTLSGLVADYRIMIRLTGLVPMAQAVRDGERLPAQSRALQWLDRVMNAALVCYYPLEHVYWLGAHRIVPVSDATVDRAGYWSCRFWAGWVALQFVRLGEERRLIAGRRRRILTRGDVDAATMQHELDALDAAARSWRSQLLINACYFPLTLHWSIRGSTFPDVAVGICGTVAAVAQACNVWRATA